MHAQFGTVPTLYCCNSNNNHNNINNKQAVLQSDDSSSAILSSLRLRACDRLILFCTSMLLFLLLQLQACYGNHSEGFLGKCSCFLSLSFTHSAHLFCIESVSGQTVNRQKHLYLQIVSHAMFMEKNWRVSS